MIDIHSHILPQLDDGPDDWETSIEMCRISAADGVTTMVASPHMLDGVYNSPKEQALEKTAQLQTLLKEHNVNLTVVPGADTHISIDFSDLLRNDKLITINNKNKYILVEFPHDIVPRESSEFLFSIQLAGVIPIITHPERNHEIQEHPELVRKWAESGNIIQLTAASITGEMGSAAESCALSFLRDGLGHVVASDAHSATWRRPGLSRARRIVAQILSEEEAEQMFQKRPASIVDGTPIEIPEPRAEPLPKKKRWFFMR